MIHTQFRSVCALYGNIAFELYVRVVGWPTDWMMCSRMLWTHAPYNQHKPSERLIAQWALFQ